MNRFDGGAISEKFEGRPDLKLYHNSGLISRNMMPMSQGGLVRCPGSKRIGALDHAVRFLSFPVSSGLVYLLEFSNLELRIRRDEEYVEVTPGVTLVIDTSYGISQLDEVQIARDARNVYFTHQDYPPKVLQYLGVDAFVVDGLGAIPSIDFTVNDGDDVPFSGPLNYPRAVCLWGGRLWFGGTINDPESIWASRTYYAEEPTTDEHLTNFARYSPVEYSYKQLSDNQDWAVPTEPETEIITEIKDIIAPSHSFVMNPASGYNCTILWMTPGRELIVGTPEVEFVIPVGTNAHNLKIDPRTRFGSAPVQGELLDNSVLFIQASAKRVREYHYSSETEGYSSPELTFLNDQVCDSGVRQVLFQREPEPILWFLLQDGTLAGFLYNKSVGAMGWFTYDIPGATIESLVVLPGLGKDLVYFALKRGSAYSWELMGDLYPADVESCQYLHSYLSVTPSSDVATGLDHLDGLEVLAWTNTGVEFGPATVASGSATFPGLGDVPCIVGLDYSEESLWKSMKLAPQRGQKLVQNIQNLLVRSWRASDGEVSYDNENFWERMDFPENWYSGDGEYPFRGDWTRDAYIHFRPIGAAPLGVLSFDADQMIGG